MNTDNTDYNFPSKCAVLENAIKRNCIFLYKRFILPWQVTHIDKITYAYKIVVRH